MTQTALSDTVIYAIGRYVELTLPQFMTLLSTPTRTEVAYRRMYFTIAAIISQIIYSDNPLIFLPSVPFLAQSHSTPAQLGIDLYPEVCNV